MRLEGIALKEEKEVSSLLDIQLYFAGAWEGREIGDGKNSMKKDELPLG